MIAKVQLDSILAAALRAFIAQRCKRAYIHEFRNSLQTVYVGIDMVARLLSGKAGTVSQDRVLEMVRRALQGHEQALTGVLQHLSGEQEDLCVVDIGTVLQEVEGFLRNDAAARGVTIKAMAPDDLQLTARPENCRLVLLSILTHAIDTMNNGGEISIAGSSDAGGVTIDFVLAPTNVDLPDGTPWQFGDAREPWGENWVLNATRQLAREDGGDIESSLESWNTRRLRVSLRYQAAKPSSLDRVPSSEFPA